MRVYYKGLPHIGRSCTKCTWNWVRATCCKWLWNPEPLPTACLRKLKTNTATNRTTALKILMWAPGNNQHAHRHTEKFERLGRRSQFCLPYKLMFMISKYFFRLFDIPTTPKTIIQKSSLTKHANLSTGDRNKLVFTKNDSNTTTPAISTHHLLQHDRPTALHVHNKALDNVYTAVNVNPFSPSSKWSVQYSVNISCVNSLLLNLYIM